MYEGQINEARSLAPIVPHVISGADTSPWMVVQYVPALGTGGAAATIAYVQASSMTFLVDAAAPTGADAIGASGVIDTSSSTYNTMGELVDYINGRQAWRAYLVGALRADLVSTMLAKTAASCIGDNGLTFYGDTSASDEVSIAISGEKFVNNGVNGHVTDADDECENYLLYAEVKLTFTGTGSLKLYTGAAGSTEVNIYNQTLTSNTEKNLGEADADEPFIRATRGQRLIIRAATTTAFSTYTKFNILGKTAVLKNDRFVDEDNY